MCVSRVRVECARTGSAAFSGVEQLGRWGMLGGDSRVLTTERESATEWARRPET